MKIRHLLFFCLISLSATHAQQKHSFEIKASEFVYDGKPIQIHSGEMHFARIPKPYWRHRLQMLKAMGLNTVATYVFWNYHNVAPGKWDFQSENRNVAEFIRIAQEEGMFVILRPGPYACAEWEFGGYPWWLQKEKSLQIRTNNQPFLDSCKVNINQLAKQVKDLQITKGGPLIMVQAENEFGSYVSQRKDIPLSEHKKYNEAIQKMLVEAGFDIPMFTSDGTWLFDGGSLKGVLPTANGEGNIENLKKAVNQYHNNEGPYMVAEYYPGWLHHWGEPFPSISATDVTKQLDVFLKNKVSFNIYMAHGGTNFGFTAGANYNDEHDIQPDLTTYDYDAPVSEAGWVTPKYMAIRDLMKQQVNYAIPAIPKQNPLISIAPIALTKSLDLLSLKKKMKPITADSTLSFEALNQGFGYVLYSKRFTQPIQGKLVIKGLRDYAVVYVNGKKKGVLNRMNKEYSLAIDIPFNATLDILVENMGRINYGAEIPNNSKGIISPVFINDNAITGNWEIYGFPFSAMPSIADNLSPAKDGRPALYAGSFDLTQVGDTFLDLKKWQKGIVFVNGHHLGRYWNVGPQQTLYLPAPFLKKGKNEIVIFEQLNDKIEPSVSSKENPILTDLTVSE